MEDCLRHLFFAVRDRPRGNTSFHVLVRSLTDFPELTKLLVRDLPVRHGPLGYPLAPWIPDDELEGARLDAEVWPDAVPTESGSSTPTTPHGRQAFVWG
jgi:hypothetical protein